MNLQTKVSSYPLQVVAAIAVIMFCAVGIAAVMDWLPLPRGYQGASSELTNSDRLLTDTNLLAARAEQPHRSASTGVSVAICSDCGVIESTREIDASGQGSGLGIVGGAAAGGLLGNQLGGSHGQEAMTVAGAAGGAIAGNQIEKQATSTKSYETVIHLNDGSTRAISETNPSTWRSGDRVKVVDGAIRPN